MSNRGYTLVELIVVIGMIGVIIGVMALTINMAMQITRMDTGQSIAMGQVHTAATWIARDVESASGVIAPDNGTTLCSLRRSLWDPSGSTMKNSRIEYVISDSVLLREVDGGTGVPVGRFFVYPDDETTFLKIEPTAQENNTYLLKLKASYKNNPFSRVYKIYQRSP